MVIVDPLALRMYRHYLRITIDERKGPGDGHYSDIGEPQLR